MVTRGFEPVVLANASAQPASHPRDGQCPALHTVLGRGTPLQLKRGTGGPARKGNPSDGTFPSHSMARAPCLATCHVTRCWSQAAELYCGWAASQLANPAATHRPGGTDHSREQWLQHAHQPGKKTELQELVGRTMHAAGSFELRYE